VVCFSVFKSFSYLGGGSSNLFREHRGQSDTLPFLDTQLCPAAAAARGEYTTPRGSCGACQKSVFSLAFFLFWLVCAFCGHETT
jgi:hypothetical protein